MVGYPNDTRTFNGAGFRAGTLLPQSDAGALPQQFQVAPVVNTRPALYRIVVRSPTRPNSIVDSYTFPLSPANLRKPFVSLTNYYDVAGPAEKLGVQRVVDFFGNAAPMIYLEGTTGWARHSTDGFRFTGLESVLRIQELISNFAKRNITQMANGAASLFTMEFYDYFTADFWQVVPIGEQTVTQDRAEPLLIRYSFRLLCIENLAQPVAFNKTDPVEQKLTQSASAVKSETEAKLATVLQANPTITSLQ